MGMGAFGLIAAVIAGVLDLIQVWLNGERRIDIDQPLGQAALGIASLLTPAPSPLRAGSDRAVLVYWLFLTGIVLSTLVFGLLLWLRNRPSRQRVPLRDNLLLGGQMLVALASLSGSAFVFAAEVAVILPLRQGLAWFALQALGQVALTLFVMFSSHRAMGDGSFRMVFIYVLLCIFLQGLTFAAARLVMRERQARLRIAAAHAELMATQLLLKDAVRSSERLRIARDLHDIIGHHLTALNLHLDLAVRQAGQPASAPLQTSRELARSLLAEVRLIVGAERQIDGVDLVAALRLLCAGIPAPRIALQLAPDLQIASPAVAHALFCCVQEAISNAVRHAGAANMRIALGAQDGAIVLEVADDGAGLRGQPEGNGLRGMRERLEQLDGTLTLEQRSGLHLTMRLPGAGALP